MGAAEHKAVELEEQNSHSQSNGERTEQVAHHTLYTEAQDCAPYSTMVGADAPVPFPASPCGTAVILADGFFPSFSKPDILSVPSFCRDSICREYAGSSPKIAELREKLLWFCHDLVQTGGLTDSGAPVSVRFYRRRLNFRDSAFKEELLCLDLIELCKTAVPGVSSECYRFTIRNGVHCREFNMHDTRLIARRGSIDEFIKSKLVGCKFPTVFLDNLKKFIPSEIFELAMNEVIENGLRAGRNMATMEAARNKILAGLYSLTIRDFRMTNHIVLLPEQVRATFTVDGERVKELDFANSHACFMVKIFEPKNESPSDAIEEHQKLRITVTSGKFYEQFMDCWEQDRDLFVDYVATKSKDQDLLEVTKQDFLTKDPRKGVKLCWQVLFNCKASPKRLFNSQVWRKFGKLYPNTAAQMAQYKKSNPRALGDQLRRSEAVMVAEVMKSFKHPCVSLYDGFLCASSRADELIEICRKVTPKHLGFVHLPK